MIFRQRKNDRENLSMNRTLLLHLMVMVCLATSHRSIAEDSAPSSHMVFDDNFPGDIIINEVRVPKDGHAMYTYYEALGWRGKGAGYAGIQVHPRAHNFIFSIWDHKEHKAPIKALHRGPGTETQKFGGEGTGLKSWNFKLGWKTGVWYTLVSRCWPDGENTNFGFWSRAGDTKKWTHLVTMSVAAKDAKFEGRTDAFIEDWLNTGKNARTTHLRGGWKRTVNGRWHAFKSAKYSVNYWDLDAGKRSFNYRTNWNGGVANKSGRAFYFMTAGGKQTRATAKNPSTHEIMRKKSKPEFRTTMVKAVGVKRVGDTLELVWDNDSQTAPQFSYEVELFLTENGIGSPATVIKRQEAHTRSLDLVAVAKKFKLERYRSLRFRVTDIFDRTTEPKVVSWK